jgi:K+/H+ antiporter YhaU regulatory subunit KhtT
MSAPRVVLPDEAPAGAARERLREAGAPGAPVVDGAGRFRGAVDTSVLEGADGGRPVAELVRPGSPAVPVEASLEAAVEALASNQVEWVTVVDGDRRVVGVVEAADLIRGQRRALVEALRRLPAAAGELVLLEEEVGEGSPYAGRSVADAGWPPGTIVVTVQHREHLHLPAPDTVLRPGDLVTLLTHRSAAERLRRALRAGQSGAPPEPEDGSGLI